MKQVQELEEAHSQAMQAIKDSVVGSIERFSTGELSPEGLLGELRELGIDAAVTLPRLTAGNDAEDSGDASIAEESALGGDKAHEQPEGR